MLTEIFIVIPILLFSITIHEYAHGLCAYYLGDNTAQLAGRLTLNPLKHLDPVGSLILPGVLILVNMMGIHTPYLGWAKPVPVNFSRLYHPKRDMIFVAFAGPLSNILLAFLSSILLKMHLGLVISEAIIFAIVINLLLAVFNLIPIPPLDGSRIVMGILPRSWAKSYTAVEPYGILIVFALLWVFDIVEKILIPIVRWASKWLGVVI